MTSKFVQLQVPAKPDSGEHPASPPEPAALKEQVIEALRSIYDPEIPLNIYDLGLIYKLTINEQREVAVKMTLTAPGCPVAGSMPGQVEAAVRNVPGVTRAEVELVWDPPWTQDRMSEAARLELGLL